MMKSRALPERESGKGTEGMDAELEVTSFNNLGSLTGNQTGKRT
jgi:hypothetical protein